MTTAEAPAPLSVGDLVRDNDPRMVGRPPFRVSAIVGDRATLMLGSDGGCFPAATNIAVARVHLDGKPRRFGWSRVDAAG